MQINCLNLLLVLLLGVIPCKIHATDTKERGDVVHSLHKDFCSTGRVD